MFSHYYFGFTQRQCLNAKINEQYNNNNNNKNSFLKSVIDSSRDAVSGGRFIPTVICCNSKDVHQTDSIHFAVAFLLLAYSALISHKLHPTQRVEASCHNLFEWVVCWNQQCVMYFRFEVTLVTRELNFATFTNIFSSIRTAVLKLKCSYECCRSIKPNCFFSFRHIMMPISSQH